MVWIIDFEASGLSRKSYPIEVGVTNGRKEFQSLINPMSHWNHWDNDAELVHNITRQQISDQGTPAKQVAIKLNTLLKGNKVYCDSVQWDSFWSNALFSDTGIHQQFEILDIQELIGNSASKMTNYLNEKERLIKSSDFILHRALNDAKIIQKSLQQALLISSNPIEKRN